VGAQLLSTVTALGVLSLFMLERLQPWQVFLAVSLQGVVKSLALLLDSGVLGSNVAREG
jgi:hypothetical protein